MKSRRKTLEGGGGQLQYKGTYRKDGARQFITACSDRTRGNGFNFKESRFRLGIKEKKILFCEGGEGRNRLKSNVLDAPSREGL